MGQENKKPTINKNTPTQGTNLTLRPTLTEEKKSEIKNEFYSCCLSYLWMKPTNKLTDTDLADQLTEIYEKYENFLSQDEAVKIYSDQATRAQEKINWHKKIIAEFFPQTETDDDIKKTKELENSRTAEQEKRANYRLERDKLWDKYFEEKELKGYEDNDENNKRLFADLEWQLELLRENWNYEGFTEEHGHWKAESTDDETESNEENFSPPEDYSDDEETEQTAEQSNEVKPVIPEITPDQYLYAPGEKEQYEEVISVIEKVIEVFEEVIPKKNKEKAKETEPEQSELSDWESQEIERLEKELLRLEKLQEAELENNKFIPPFIPIYTEYKQEEPEQAEPEASTSKSTEPIEPKELSPESQQIINKIQNIYFTDPAESGNQVEKIFAPEIRQRKTEYQISKSLYIEIPTPFGKEKKIDNTNRLYKLTEKERQEKKNDYQGLDRILYDKLLEKVGTIQKPTKYLVANQIVESIAVATPFAGNAKAVIDINTYLSHIDNLQIGLEKSFSIAEVKEIVAQTRQADYDQLEAVKNWVIQMDNENKDLLKNATEREAQKDKEFADLQKDKDAEIKKLKQQALDFIKQKQEIETKKAETLGQSKKLLESKEKVDLDTITEKYRILEQNAQNSAEQLEIKDRKLSEYIAFIYQLEQEKEILGGEFSILIDRVLRIEAEKLLLDSELFAKSNELKRTIDKKNGELELLTNSKDREIAAKDLKLSQWDEWEIKRKGTIDQAEKDREQYRQDFLKIRD